MTRQNGCLGITRLARATVLGLQQVPVPFAGAVEVMARRASERTVSQLKSLGAISYRAAEGKHEPTFDEKQRQIQATRVATPV